MINHTQIIELIEQVDAIKSSLVSLLKESKPGFVQGDMVVGYDVIDEFVIFEAYNPTFPYPYLCKRIASDGTTLQAHKAYKSIRHMIEKEVVLLDKIKKIS